MTKDEIKEMSKQKIKKLGSLMNSSGKTTYLLLALAGGLASTFLPLALGSNFFLCTLFNNSGSGNGVNITPGAIVRGLILGAPVIGLVFGLVDYFSNAKDGDAGFKDVWQPAVVGLAVPVLAVMMNSLVGIDLSCLWSG